MNPATRTLKQVTIESATAADLVFSTLMGDEVAPRRAFIESHAKYAKLDI
jgi:DNA gyrase subunit B